jgi:hypothetical protein
MLRAAGNPRQEALSNVSALAYSSAARESNSNPTTAR